jgi:LacI family transcriptional regulator
VSAIQDVAKRAGVAPITVSRVVNNSGYVSKETRQRVEAAIRELDYIPNALGPSLRSKRTMTLGLILADLTNPFWMMVARGVEDTAYKVGYHVIFGNMDESPQKQDEYVSLLLQRQVDGFLLLPVVESHSLVTLQKRRVPFVTLDMRILDATIDSVRGDSIGGAYRLTRHLLELGHRRIAIVSGPQSHSTAYDRVAGFLQAMDEAGLRDAAQVYWGEYKQQSGYERTQQLLQTDPRPTAIFAANNFLAIGAMRALLAASLRVPEEMSVVAFDDLPDAITIDPFLTVASQPAYEMGQRATELLLSRLAGEGPEGPQEIVLPVEIIIRKSTGKPPATF